MLDGLVHRLMDYGLVDVMYVTINGKKNDAMIEDSKFKRVSNNTDSDETWVCFLPWRVTIEEAQNLGLLPRTSNYLVYEVPPAIVNPNPTRSKDLMMSIVEDFARVEKDLGRYNILGYSVGLYPAIFIANNFSPERLVLVGPGSKLGACLWEGVATQEVRRRSQHLGISTATEYDDVLRGTNPIENITNLPPNIEVHLAMHDRYIPTRFGLEFITALDQKGKQPKVYHYKAGHILTLLRFGATHNL